MAKVDWEASYNAKSAEVERLKSKLETYEHGLEYVTVDAQEAAIADATHDLREEVERLKAELDKAKLQRDAMFHEIETLLRLARQIKAHFKAQNERVARESQRRMEVFRD